MVEPVVPGPGGGPVAPPSTPTSPAAAAAGAAGSAGRPLVLPEGWTVTVTDRIVSTVDAVRSKTTAPITLVARGLVYGLLLATAGAAALVLLLALVVRSLVVLVGLVPWIADRPGRSVWIVDLMVGLVLLLAGRAVMAKGRVPDEDRHPG